MGRSILPEVYLSAPAVMVPERTVTNDDVVAMARRAFRGTDEEWTNIERRIRFVFRHCGSEVRHIEEEAPLPVADHAVRVSRACLEAQKLDAADLDAVLYGGIPREYFEPATASEIAMKLGAQKATVYDVTSACAGFLLAAHSFVSYAAVDDAVRTGLVTCADITAGHLSYEVQCPEDLELLAAGLTIGNGSAAVALSRTPLPSCGRVVAMLVEALPEHHPLTRAPLSGPFVCRSTELFGLARYVPDHIRSLVGRAGWKMEDVSWIASHQPSTRLIREVCRLLPLDPDRAPSVHHLYGNTAASAVPLALDHIVRERGVRPGDKVILSTQAAGFIMCSLAVEWVT